MSSTTPPPGWYPDPSAAGSQRYWDGANWTASVSPMPGYVPPAQGYLPAAPAYAVADYQPAQVSFTDAVKLGFRKYGTFAGRATRAEYWWWYLFSIVVFVPLYLMVLAAGAAMPPTSSGQEPSAGLAITALVLIVLMLVVGLALFVPTISVMVRRLHDTGKTGWWYWMTLIPFGGIVLLVFLATESDRGPNQYGLPSRGAAEL